ncbi:MAG: PKD domain-containing protein [Candidatus Korarchaeota archaeon]|nr:PKD domain-containing protein [Candidatus Korarchaeota archaeon]
MRATKIPAVLAILTLTLLTITVSADTGCPAVDSSADQPPRVIEISVYRISSKTVELIGVVEDPDSGLRKWIWDFGDGTVVNKTGGWSRIGDSTYKMVIQHTYSDYRTYWVKLKVIDDWLKESDVKTVPINVKKSNYKPVVRLIEITPNPAQPKEKITFVAEGIDPDGHVVTYYWDFGDGKKTNGANLTRVTHTYSKEGTYVLKVKVKDDKGAYSDAVTKEIYIRSESKPKPKNKPPSISSVDLTPREPSVGTLVVFRATALDPDGDRITFEWKFGDGTIKNGGAKITHIYRREGAFTVKVRAIDQKGASSPFYTLSVAVKGNKPPQATIIGVRTLDNVTFLFQGMGIDPDGQVVAYQWDFGDGEKVNGSLEGNSIPHKFLNHTYERSGNYTVKFRVRDDKGAWSLWATTRVAVLVPSKVNSATLGTFDFSNVGIAVGVGAIIVSVAGYLAYRESKSSTFIERSKRNRRIVVRRPPRSVSGVYRNTPRNGRTRKKKRPWP